MTTKKRRGLIVLCLLSLLSPAGAGRGAASPRAGAQEELRTVRLVVGTKGDGEPVPTLRPEDVRVTEGGVERRVVSLAAETDAPLAVALVVDVSASQELLLPAVKSAAADFLRDALRPGRDRVAVVSFSHETIIRAALSPDVAAASAAVAELKADVPAGYIGGGVVVSRLPPGMAGRLPPGVIVGPPNSRPGAPMPGSTSFWDALAFVGREVFRAADADAARVVVLLSDGVDTSSGTKRKAAVESLLAGRVLVYSLGVGDAKHFDGIDKDSLRKVAEESGGLAVFPRRADDLSPAFARIRDAMRAHHLLTYASPPASAAAPKKPPKLKIEIVNPELRRRGLLVGHPPHPAR